MTSNMKEGIICLSIIFGIWLIGFPAIGALIGWIIGTESIIGAAGLGWGFGAILFSFLSLGPGR